MNVIPTHFDTIQYNSPSPCSIKQLQGPRTLDQAYIEHEKARIAKQEAAKVKKLAKAEERAMQRVAKAAE